MKKLNTNQLLALRDTLVKDNDRIILKFDTYEDLAEGMNVLFMLNIKGLLSSYRYSITIFKRNFKDTTISGEDYKRDTYNINNISEIVEV